MNIPNTLTLFRLFLVPVFVIIFFSPLEYSLYYSVMVFILAGLTDVLDGYIARKYNRVTKWGQVIDPFADKVMQLTVLLCFVIKDLLPVWLIIIYGLKELTMIFGGIFLYSKKEKVVIPANSFGKAATLLFYLAILSVLVVNYKYSTIIFIIAIAFALLAFYQYSIIGREKLNQIKQNK